MDGLITILGFVFFAAFVTFTILLLYGAARAGDEWLISRGRDQSARDPEDEES